MTHEEELELCLKMGVREDWAELILKWLGGKNQSALPRRRNRVLRFIMLKKLLIGFWKGFPVKAASRSCLRMRHFPNVGALALWR